MGLFTKIAEGLKKTKDSFLGGLQRIFNSFTKIDEELFEELEEQMIMSDIGVDTSVEIECVSLLRKGVLPTLTTLWSLFTRLFPTLWEMIQDLTCLFHLL